MTLSALAIFAHPDDIEFVAAGTLLLLKTAGWNLHYMNVSSGSLGSATMSVEDTIKVRKTESQRAAKILGAEWLPSLSNDLEIVFDIPTLRRLAAVVRAVNPQIVLTHSPVDYMEDHMMTCRLAVSAAFTRGMPNFETDPRVDSIDSEVTVYHAQPHMNRDPLGAIVRPSQFVDISAVMETKRAALSAHESQRAWLDASQGMDSYVKTMEQLGREVGEMSSRFEFAEGWRKHLHAGFCGPAADPLAAALGMNIFVES
jgi:LmbE family N-acetylglucosaminyl deacetylase